MRSSIGNIWHLATRNNTVSIQVLLTTATNFSRLALGLISGIAVARLLGPEGRGELAIIQMWPSLLTGIGLLGLPDGLVYFSARLPNMAGRYLGSSVILGLLSSMVFLLLGFALLPIVLAAQPSHIIEASQHYLLLLPATALSGIPYSALQGGRRFDVWNGLRLIPNVLWIVILGYAWLSGNRESCYVATRYLWLLFLSVFPVWWSVTRFVKGPYRPDLTQWGPLLKYSLLSLSSTIPKILSVRLDQMILAIFLPTPTLGLYAVAVTWSSIVPLALNALGNVLFPRIASEEKDNARVRILLKGVHYAIILALPLVVVAIPVTLVGMPTILGSEYTGAVPATLVLILANAIAGITKVLEESVRGLGKPRLALWAEGTGLVVAIVFLWPLLPMFGLVGAAIAAVLGHCVAFLIIVLQMRNIIGCPISILLCPTHEDVFAILSGFIGLPSRIKMISNEIDRPM